MAENGLPLPIFSTDEQSDFLVSRPVCDRVSDQASDQVKMIIKEQIHYRVEEVLSLVVAWRTRKELFDQMKLSNHTTNRKKYLDPLVDLLWIELEYPENKTHPKQRYRLTDTGKKVLSLIRN